jgi:hypothetical protein
MFRAHLGHSQLFRYCPKADIGSAELLVASREDPTSGLLAQGVSQSKTRGYPAAGPFG